MTIRTVSKHLGWLVVCAQW